MSLHARGGRVAVGGARMEYIRFGGGARTLVMIPGLGDGLKTVRGTALPMALSYRRLARAFTVYLFSRRDDLPPGFSTRDMARDLARAMDALGLRSACVLGVSQGGMIAQWLAIDHPEKVERLILAVTLARQNEVCRAALEGWIAMAERGDGRALMLDTARRSYSKDRLRRYGWAYALSARMLAPRRFDRFLVQARACLAHDAYDALPSIRCPTLVIGGAEDRIATAAASREIAARVPGGALRLYPNLGHAAYEEAPDFLDAVAAFFLQGGPVS